MSKYQPLTERLAGHRGEEWRASFADIEALLGFPLPKAARKSRAWWTGAQQGHTRAWMTSGWEVGEVDPIGGSVVFRRPVSDAAMQGAPADQPAEVDPLGNGGVSPGAPVRRQVRRWGGAAMIAAGAVATLGAALAVGLMRRRGEADPRA